MKQTIEEKEKKKMEKTIELLKEEEAVIKMVNALKKQSDEIERLKVKLMAEKKKPLTMGQAKTILEEMKVPSLEELKKKKI